MEGDQNEFDNAALQAGKGADIEEAEERAASVSGEECSLTKEAPQAFEKVTIDSDDESGTEHKDKANGLTPISTDDIELQNGAFKPASTSYPVGRFPEHDEEPLDNGLCNSGLCRDPEYRNKLIKTLWLWWLSVAVGWLYGQLGPTLPDLQLISGTTLQQASWLFTSFAVGYLAGCIASGLIIGRLNPLLLLFVYTSGCAVVVAVIPWSGNFYFMAALRFLNGLFTGGMDTGLHSQIFAIWGADGGRYLQVTHFLVAIGGIISPLAASPFLAPEAEIVTTDPAQNSSAPDNMTLTTISAIVTQATLNESLADSVDVAPSAETKVQFAFLISGLILLSAAIPFLVSYVQNRKSQSESLDAHGKDDSSSQEDPERLKYVAFGVICVISMLGTAFVDMFPNYLTSFGFYQLGWTKTQASSATAIFFALYAVGNFMGLFILECVKTGILIFVSYALLAVAMALLLMAVFLDMAVLVWVLVAVVGLAMSPILPTIFTWTQENVVPITGAISSIFLTTGSLGGMINPLLLGYLMDTQSPMWFLYLISGQVVFCAALYTFVVILSKRFEDKPEVTRVERQLSVTSKTSACYRRRCLFYC